MSGEAAFIASLRALAQHPAARDLQDDAAVLEIGTETLVLTHDMLVEGVHFLPSQPRADVATRLAALRTVMDVLQDLGFIIERANEPLGLVSAARFAEPSYNDVLSVTVTVREAGEGRFTIRANAVHNNRPVVDAETYQKFFAAIERSFVLTRQ